MSEHESHNHHHHHGEKKNRNTAGKLLTLIQLIASVVLVLLVWNSGMLPDVYTVMIAVVLVILFMLLFAAQFSKKRVINVLCTVISLLIAAVLIFACVYLQRTVDTMEEIGGATYKTDNMIVVVLEDDPAETILDAKDYVFGDQTVIDQENTELMLEDLTSILGQEPEITEYEALDELGQALLDKEIDAAVYNEGYAGIIDDAVEGYSEQVRILYQYGIETPIEIERYEEDDGDDIYDEEEDTAVSGVDEPFNVYISGIDVAGPITTNSRSDVNIIMTVNPKTKEVLLTTTPRDYYVTIPGISGGSRDKLTHAGIYGVDASMRTLSNLYGINIDYYVRVNFTSLVTIVDALGGVDVVSEYDFTTRSGSYHFNKGTNHVNGDAALAFARERYAFADGDNQRGKNQEALLTAILQKAMSPAIISSANQILNNISGCVQTNMTYDEMARLINQQISDPGDWKFESVAATGSGDSQKCYSTGNMKLYVMWPNNSSVSQISAKMKEVLSGN